VKLIFVDTSAFYAVMDRDDNNHDMARSSWPELIRDQRLLTNNYVLVETTALIQHRLGLAALHAFSNDVLPLLRVEWVTEAGHRSALEALLTAGRKKLSLVDCVSFQTMRECGVNSAFCFDTHFKEQGFQIVP